MTHRLLTAALALLTSLTALYSEAQRHEFNPTLPAVHDPVMAMGEDGRYYIFSTGMGISVMSSADMKTWQMEKPVFNPRTEIPAWAVSVDIYGHLTYKSTTGNGICITPVPHSGKTAAP